MEKFPQSQKTPESPEKSDHTDMRSKARAFLKTIGLAGLLGSSLLSSENVSAQQNASPKRDTIFTANPADPRITAYKDSLNAHKAYKALFDDVDYLGPELSLDTVREQILKAQGSTGTYPKVDTNGWHSSPGQARGSIIWSIGKQKLLNKQGSYDDYINSTDLKAGSYRALLPSSPSTKKFSEGKYDYAAVYNEPVQPVAYKKEAVPDTFSRTPDTYTVYGPNGGLLGSVDQSGVFSPLPASERAHLSDGLGMHAGDKKVLEEWDAGEVPPYLAQQGVKK